MLINIYRREKEREREKKKREGRAIACLPYDNCQYRDIRPCVRSWRIQNATGNREISMVSGFAQMRTREIRSCHPLVSRVLSYGIRHHCVTGKAKQNIPLIFVSTQEKKRCRKSMRACAFYKKKGKALIYLDMYRKERLHGFLLLTL